MAYKTARSRLMQAFEKRFWAKVKRGRPDECWLWTGSTRAGYGQVAVAGKPIGATHVALELDGRDMPAPGMLACHTCDNPACVNPAHLWWGTHTENSHDMLGKGRRPPTYAKGESNSSAILTEEQVRAIYKAKGTYPMIGEKYGVARETVSGIKNRHKWKHLDLS